MDGAGSSDLASLLALLAICGVLFLAGRATVELLTFPDAAGGATISNPAVVAAGAGGIPVLLLAWGLKATGLLGFWSMMGGLATIIACAGLLRRSFRESLFHPLRKFDALSGAYIASVLTFLFLLRPFEYPLKEIPDYLTPGFDLFMPGVEPTTVPYFGSIVLQPVLYARHVISALVSVLSYPSHFFFFSTGLYLIVALVAPTIPIGAYVFFRRYLTGWLALAVAILFCGIVLHYKTWLLRADSLAWISGFACLIVQADMQAASRRQGLTAATAGTAVLTILLYSVTFLTDAVVGLIVALFAAGLAIFHIWRLARGKASRLLWQSFVMIGFCAVGTLGLTASFARSYSSCATLVHECERVPARAGSIAGRYAAIPPDRLDGDLPNDLQTPTLQPPPPYLWAGKVAEITALLAPAAPFIHDIAYAGVHEFPSLIVGKLESLSFAHILVSTIVFLLCCFLQLFYGGRVGAGESAFFCASASSYISLILFAVGLDRLSTEVLAIVIARHTLLYAAFFYWSAVFLTLAVFLIAPMASHLRARFGGFRTKPIETLTLLQLSTLLLWLPQKILRDRLRGMTARFLKPAEEAARKRVAEAAPRDVALVLLFSPFRWIASRTFVQPPRRPSAQGWHGVALVCLIPAWFLFSINSGLHRPLGPMWIGQRLAECVKHGCGSPAVLLQADLRSLAAAADFVRANSDPGDWVFSNVISESRFGFLTAGRNSLLDGVLAGVPDPEQKASAARLQEYARFARTADPKYLGRAEVRLFVLYKHADCRVLACYGDRVVPTDLAAFARRGDFSNVMENDDYVIYQWSAAAAPGQRGGSGSGSRRRPLRNRISGATPPRGEPAGID